MFFKRLSRSRSNSQSYVDDYSPEPRNASRGDYDDGDYSHHTNQRPGSSSHQQAATSAAQSHKPASMYSAHNDVPIDHYGHSQASHQNGYSNSGSGRRAASLTGEPTSATSHHAPGLGGAGPGSGVGSSASDLLTRAFNEAIRPYTTRVEDLEAEVADLKLYASELEAQRKEVHAWIDKRGLRPDVPPSIADQMDASSPHNPTHAAATLNAQLDRKITIVNFDLHRLQDDLNDSLPTPSFSACMLKFLPDIARLSALPSGPRFAFDLLLKLGGNLNSHGGLESGDEADLRERRSFYAKLDDGMVDVVRGRFIDEGAGWGVQREIKRIEKTGAYLRNWGVEPYFPKTLDVMRDGLEGGGAGSGGAVGGGGVGGHGGLSSSASAAQQHQQQPLHAQQQPGGSATAGGGGGTPPAYA